MIVYEKMVPGRILKAKLEVCVQQNEVVDKCLIRSAFWNVQLTSGRLNEGG
jgi:hypothetical protein